MVKHPTGIDIGNLDLEEVDKEMAADKVALSMVPADDAPGNAPADDDAAVDDPSTFEA